MSIIGKKLPEFTLDAFKKPELVKVSTADVLGKWSVFVFYPADFTFVCPTELEDVQNSYAELKNWVAKFTPYPLILNMFISMV